MRLICSPQLSAAMCYVSNIKCIEGSASHLSALLSSIIIVIFAHSLLRAGADKLNIGVRDKSDHIGGGRESLTP